MQTRGAAALLVLLALAVLSSCFSPYTGEGGISVAIGGVARSAWTDEQTSRFSHTITIKSAAGSSVTRDGIETGESVFVPLAPGSYTVSVEAFDGDDKRAWSMPANAEVRAGKNTAVTVEMLAAAGLYDVSANKYDFVMGISAGDDPLGDIFGHINEFPDSYLLLLDNDLDVSFEYTNEGNYSLVAGSLTIMGLGAERTITVNTRNTLLSVSVAGILTLEKNITLKGNDTNNWALVDVRDGGTFYMKEGSKLTGNTNAGGEYGDGGGVSVYQGTFTMEGGTISGNKALNGGGVYVDGGAESNAAVTTFTMTGGTISGNKAHTVNDDYIVGSPEYGGSGGGVMISGSADFLMEGGTISANEAVMGGGVLVEYGTTFKKSGGTIYGEDEEANSNNATASINREESSWFPAGHPVLMRGFSNVFVYRINYKNKTSAADNILEYYIQPDPRGPEYIGWDSTTDIEDGDDGITIAH